MLKILLTPARDFTNCTWQSYKYNLLNLCKKGYCLLANSIYVGYNNLYVKKMCSYNFSVYLECVLLIEQSEDIVLTWTFRNLSDNYGAFDDCHEILNENAWYKDKAKYE